MPVVAPLIGLFGGVCVASSDPGQTQETSGKSTLPDSTKAQTSLTLPGAFKYEPSRRDPFIDSSVDNTLLSRNTAPTESPKQRIQRELEEKLHEELIRRHKISGIVCAEKGGAALINHRIIHTNDKLDLLLQEESVVEIAKLDKAAGVAWREASKSGVLSFNVEWITPYGIGVSNILLENTLTIPFIKRAPLGLVASTPAIPK